MKDGFSWADINNFYQEWPDSADKKPGCLLLPAGESSSRYCPAASERIKVIPESEWGDLLADEDRVNLDRYVPTVLDQDGVGCHDDKTEVLTEVGWQLWEDYDRKSALGTINPATHELEFQTPSAFHAYEYNGPIHRVDRRSMSFAVTPNHRMYVRGWNEKERKLGENYEVRRADKVGWCAGLLASPSGFVGANIDAVTIGNTKYRGDDFIALVSLVVSDGWVGGSESTWNRVSFCCFRQDRYQMVAELAKRLGFDEYDYRPGVWVQRNPALASWFRANMFSGDCFRAPSKRIPQIVKCASGRQAGLFLHFYGDQHISESGRRAFYTSSPVLADDLQEMLMHVGRRSGICEHKPRGTQFKDGRHIDVENVKTSYTVSEWTCSNLSVEQKKVAVDHYSGMVYCATVPNSLLVTRREKQVLISGNSCATESSTGAVLVQRAFDGQQFVELNPWFIYRVTSGGRDSGSNIDSNLAFLREHGVAPEALHPRSKGWRAKPSEEAIEAAKNYRIDEFYDIRNTAEFVSALLQGFVVVYGRRMHSILAVYLLDSRKMKYLNSWKYTWGDNGRGVDTLSGVNYGYGAYAVRTVTHDAAPAPVIPRVSEMPPMIEKLKGRRKSK